MPDHHCHANDCPTRTSPAVLMCAKHWRMVPVAMQRKVWSTYKKRGSPGGEPLSWAEYYEASADAVEHVAAIENKPIENAYRRSAPRFRDIAAQQEIASTQQGESHGT
jgi:hypothetical protein